MKYFVPFAKALRSQRCRRPQLIRQLCNPMLLLWLCNLVFGLSLVQVEAGQAEKAARNPSLARKEVPKSVGSSDVPYQRMGQFLGGIAGENGQPPLTVVNDASWKAHAKGINGIWTKYERQRLSKMRQWADVELGTIQSASFTIFYPFGGPDAIHVLTIFPKSRVYVLVGLEKPGSLPDISRYSEVQLKQLYKDIEKALRSIVMLGFFKTREMDSDLRKGEIKGTLPIVLLLMSRTGFVVKDVRQIALDADGNILGGDALAETQPNGYEIRFAGPGGDEKSLYYFSVNLDDGKLKAYPNFAAYVERLGGVTTFIKSASYLLHKANFSVIRQLILSRSDVVVQDDSGVPYKYFSRKQWAVSLYGTYDQPIPLFSDFAQENLRKAFGDPQSKAKPLPISIGYGKPNKSNLILAQRKDAPR